MLEGTRAAIVRDDRAGGSWVHLARNEFPRHNDAGGGRVVYFPYHGVPVGPHMEVDVRKAEVECLLELEYLLEVGLINSLLLELVQVTTGYILSVVFLADLSSLFRRYNAKIVVDEVMTAGRTSKFLLYSTMLGIQADYITMGKWVMGGLVLRRDMTVGPWDGSVASMARQGAVQYGQVGSTVGDSMASSITSMAANLRSIKRMIDASGKQQLGKVVSACRDRFIQHLIEMFPRKDLHFWGVGGMVYCNVAANRATQLRSRFLLLITPREVRFDLTRVRGTTANRACSPYVDDTLLHNAQEAMRDGLGWCGRLMTPSLRLLHGSPEQIAAARKAQQPVVPRPNWVAGPHGGSFPPSRLSKAVVPRKVVPDSKAAAPPPSRGVAKGRKNKGPKLLRGRWRMAELAAQRAAAALLAASGQGSSSDPPPLVGAVQDVQPDEAGVDTESEEEPDDTAQLAACMARQYAAAAAAAAAPAEVAAEVESIQAVIRLAESQPVLHPLNAAEADAVAEESRLLSRARQIAAEAAADAGVSPHLQPLA